MVLGASAAGAYFFYGDQLAERYGRGGGERHSTKKESVADDKKGGAGGPILTLEPFIFNLAGNNTKFAKVSLAVQLQDAQGI